MAAPWWSVTMVDAQTGAAVIATVTVQADDAEAAIEAAKVQAVEHVDTPIDDMTFLPSPLPTPPSE